MASHPLTRPHAGNFLAFEGLGALLVTALLFVTGTMVQIWLYESIEPLAFIILVASPVAMFLWLRRASAGPELAIFMRTIAAGTLAAGIAAYYRIELLDPYQVASDASSFFELSSLSGKARSIRDLQTITEGAGAVVMWSAFYDFADLLGFERLPYVGITMNILMVSLGAVVCLKSARALYGEDRYRFGRLELFFTISGVLWLFAGVHIRDSVIFLCIVVMAHFWISYLSQLDRAKILPALIVTGAMMPALQALRNEFFYMPLLASSIALLALNFSRGRGDSRFIMLTSAILGTVVLIVAAVAFGSQISQLFLMGQDTYGTLSLEEARAGSLGVSLIIDQILPIRLMLGVPYLLFYPIPFWIGLQEASAVQLFKSMNALSFYFIAAYAFVGLIRICMKRQLRSPAFVFIAAMPFSLTVMIALTSLETRHLGAFMGFFFLLGLLPDLRERSDNRLFRFTLTLVLLAVGMVHFAWSALRYA